MDVQVASRSPSDNLSSAHTADKRLRIYSDLEVHDAQLIRLATSCFRTRRQDYLGGKAGITVAQIKAKTCTGEF